MKENDNRSAACNKCKVALDLQRYNDILLIISNFIKQQVPTNVTVLTDLSDQYQFPPCLALSDLVAYMQQPTKLVTLVELTVCYETTSNMLNQGKKRSIF